MGLVRKIVKALVVHSHCECRYPVSILITVWPYLDRNRVRTIDLDHGTSILFDRQFLKLELRNGNVSLISRYRSLLAGQASSSVCTLLSKCCLDAVGQLLRYQQLSARRSLLSQAEVDYS
jgi:hypothetical protein